MVRKRALVTSRDVRGAVMTLLLPILAVAAVLVHSLLHSTCRLRKCLDVARSLVFIPPPVHRGSFSGGSLQSHDV